ncbi:MAG: hypothetical protein H6710_13330 [Myxococcales bacterium]|nr:hypothetical protein [Myxococcales bacterium]
MPRAALRPALAALALALGLVAGCKSQGSSESEAPGEVTAVEGPAYCPRSVPTNGSSCPRGSSDFCVYRTTTTDFACVCGGGNWSCAAK